MRVAVGQGLADVEFHGGAVAAAGVRGRIGGGDRPIALDELLALVDAAEDLGRTFENRMPRL